MTQETPRSRAYPSLVVNLTCVGFVALVAFLLMPVRFGSRPSRTTIALRAELTELENALEYFKTTIGQGEYPPSTNDDPDEVRRFLAKAFPKYHGGLPEKYKNLDPATSLVFWLGGMTDKDGKLIGFSYDPKNPFDETSASRMPTIFEFAANQLRVENGLPVFFPHTASGESDPYVYFRPNAKGTYHGASHNCRPCRDSKTGDWINPTTYQLFGPGIDGKYGSGVQYPNGADYDEQRKDDMSNFMQGSTLGNDMR